MLGLSQIKNFLKDSVVGIKEYNTEAREKLSWRLEWKIVKHTKETTT